MEATALGIVEIWINGDQVDMMAPVRLASVDDLIASRRATLDAAGPTAKHVGDAFRVHVCGNVARLVDDDVCRASLELIARHGERTGVVGIVYAERVAAEQAFAPSHVLARALDAGRAFRMVEPHGAPGLIAVTGAEKAAEALVVAARLVVGQQPADLEAALNRMLSGDTESSRSVFAAALRATADMLAGTALMIEKGDEAVS